MVGLSSATCALGAAEERSEIEDENEDEDEDDSEAERSEALAAEQQPQNAEFPVLEAVDVRMGLIIEVMEGAGGNEVFAAAFAAAEQEGNVGDLFGEDEEGAGV